jgi:hypothetical protein
MFELSPPDDPDIARHDVSEDGVTWRAFDPVRDAGKTLHRRIEFAPPQTDGAPYEARPMPCG